MDCWDAGTDSVVGFIAVTVRAAQLSGWYCLLIIQTKQLAQKFRINKEYQQL